MKDEARGGGTTYREGGGVPFDTGGRGGGEAKRFSFFIYSKKN